MQSDPRVTAAITALKPRIAQYRYAASTALERARTLLASDMSPVTTGVALGEFASGRIDPEKFAMISEGSAPLDVVGCAVLDRAIETLQALLDSGDELFILSVPQGTSLSAAIRTRLAKIGSAFSVASLVELVRRRSYDPLTHGFPFDEYPFEKWTSSERRLVAPLFVRVHGADINPFELAKFIDGSVQLVLIVDGPCAPAPLARLISPNVLVAQIEEIGRLDKLAEVDGPALIGIMNGAEARFIHDPRLGAAMWQQMRIIHIPDAPVRKSLGDRSAWQQREDLSFLKSLVELPVSGEHAKARLGLPAANIDPTERLTAWLLEQSSVAAAS